MRLAGAFPDHRLAPAAVAALGLSAVPGLAQEAPPLLCLFSPDCGDVAECDSAAFTIEIAPIDHEPGWWFTYATGSIPVREVTAQGDTGRSFVTAAGDTRDLLSVFADGEAVHSRHFTRAGDGPAGITSYGQCEVLR